jgi:large exoprotein involved in heme utilization and adhesion
MLPITINTTGELALGQGSGILNEILEKNIGKAGDINIQTSSLNLQKGSFISTSTLGNGDGGEIFLNANDTVSVNNSTISSRVENKAEGNGGDIEISAGNLTLINDGQIDARTFGKGNSGNINININDTIALNNSQVRSSGFSQVGGNGGEIGIKTGNLTLTNNSQIDASTAGKGNGGNIKVTSERISIDGRLSGISSGLFEFFSRRDGGEIKIITGNLTLTNGGQIGTSANGQGKAGKIEIIATGKIYIDREGKIISGVAPGVEGDANDIKITTHNLTLNNESLIGNTNNGTGNPGSINIIADNNISLDNSYISNLVANTKEENDAGDIEIVTDNLSLTNSGRINTSTSGKGNAGSLNITANNTISIDGFIDEQDGNRFHSGILSAVDINGKGSGGDIEIATDNLILTNSGQINTSTSEKGNAGRIKISANNISANNSLILSGVGASAEGKGGEVIIETSNLTLTNIGQINTSTFGKGNGGNIKVTSDRISIDGRSSGIFTGSSSLEDVNAGNIEINTNNLTLTNRGEIVTSTFSQGDAGNIKITAMNNISVDNSFITSGSLLATEALTIAEGNGGDINIQTPSLLLKNGALLTAQSSGLGNAGNIKVNAEFITLERNSSIFASNTPLVDISTTLSGGNIDLQISDNLILRDSDISTEATINSNGGNIDIAADAVIAFDDSDIFAFAADGQGGNITLDTPAYFAENFTLNSLTSDPDSLVNNSRADINATGAVSGSVTIPDVSFIQNSLTELANDSLNTDELVANSCVVPVGDRKEGKFIITGTQSLPLRPGDGIPSNFPTGEVRSVPEKHSSWQPGDPIVEPQGAYRLANGKLVLSRECSQ